MPKVAFKEENVKKNDYDYPKIKLKKNEVARIVLLEEPVAEFVHNIRKPKLNGGVPEKTIKTRRDNTTYEDYVYEFVARPICLGDYATLEREGSDPKHCPICEEATRSDHFSAPQRRFALHVVKYETQPGSNVVKLPFTASTLIWSFTDKVFSKLFEFTQEWGDLRQHDITLKCENEPFQTYDMQVNQKAEWMEDETRQQFVKGLMRPENLAPDPSLFCGSKKSETSIGYDIKAVKEAWAIAEGRPVVSPTDAAMSSVGASLNLSDGIDDLLGGANSASEAAAATDAEGWAVSRDDSAPASSFEDLVGEDSSSKKSSGVNIDDILGNL